MEAQRGARDALNTLGGASRLSTGKLRRESARADKEAYDAAMAYRKEHAPRDAARAKANRTTDAQLDQFESAVMNRKGK